MKAFIFSQWAIDSNTEGLLFFAQALEEMLFHYGHDSLKMPALNFDYLCVELSKTIEKIENDIIDKGNIKPIYDELFDSFSKDPIAIALYGEDLNKLFYAKSAQGEYIRNCADLHKDCTSDSSLRRIKKTIEFLLDDMSRDNRYFNKLKEKIISVINTKPFGLSEKSMLYELTRNFLAELTNSFYSQEYIYLVTNDIFYNPNRKIENVSNALDEFWSRFDFKEKKYKVFLPLSDPYFVGILKNFKNIVINKNKTRMFEKSCRWIIEFEIQAYDPEQARIRTTELVSFYLSLMQYGNHKNRPFYQSQACVVDLDTQTRYDLNKAIPPIQRGRNLNQEQINKTAMSMVDNFASITNKIVNVIELHSSAIDSNDIGNQLLNLWTIIEILIDTEKSNSFSKINQICNTLTSVLNINYIPSLISQLYQDVNRCLSSSLDDIISRVAEGRNIYDKLVAILVLPEYSQQFEEIQDGLGNYPLLQYRIQNYKEIFSCRDSIKNILNCHRKRLEWQIMRIYRNRNMIVHDGSYFPYIEIIIQNLHYYVDCLIDTIDYYASIGYEQLSTIYSAIRVDEYKHILLLEQKEKDKLPKAIGEDFITVILGK